MSDDADKRTPVKERAGGLKSTPVSWRSSYAR